MALHNENFEDQDDLARFLDKFKERDFLSEEDFAAQTNLPPKEPLKKDTSFEKLARKIQELEGRFDASEEQNERILHELNETRQSVERQHSKDEFIAHLSDTIASLKASVEKLSHAQQEQSFAFREDTVQRGFDTFPPTSFRTGAENYTPVSHQRDSHRQEQEEKERIISSLHYKASQLKAVNSALDREIKKVQQEKMEALKKSAEQAKEILSLRDQLTQAEERFKSFDFGGAGKPDVPYGVRDHKLKFGGQMVEYGRFEKINNKLVYSIASKFIAWKKRLKLSKKDDKL